MSIRDLDYNLKKLDFIQRKKKISNSARSKIIGEIAKGVADFNKERGLQNKKEAESQLFAKNLDKAHDIFNKEGKHRKIFGPS